MAKTIRLIHPQGIFSVRGFYGFSWTTFFFAFFPALFRSDFVNAAILFGISMLLWLLFMLIFPINFFIVIAFQIGWAFIYNRRYTKKYLDQGFIFDKDDPNFDEAILVFGLNKDKVLEQNKQINNPKLADDSKLSTLEKLAELKDKGIISEEEFNAKKKEIIQ